MGEKIRDQVDLIGNWRPHLMEWAKVRRPDAVAQLELLLSSLESSRDKTMCDAITMLAGMAYAAGRTSVVAEVEKTTITEVERSRR